MLKLYGNSFSQCSRRVVALMVEAGIDYDENEVDLMGGAQYTPEFLAMNPNHSVPTIKDGDVCINESNAILRYLCNKHGLDNWYPTDPVARANVDQWLDWSATRLNTMSGQIVFNTVFAGDKADQAALAAGKKILPEISGIIEDQLTKTDFIAGDSMTIADLSISSCLFQLGMAKLPPPMA